MPNVLKSDELETVHNDESMVCISICGISPLRARQEAACEGGPSLCFSYICRKCVRASDP